MTAGRIQTQRHSDHRVGYKTTIPQVFWYNALVILSNRSQAKVGSLSANLPFPNAC